MQRYFTISNLQEDLHDSSFPEESIDSENPKRKRVRVRTELAKLRRNEQRRINPLPRILKRDIRRDYSKMFINVMNSFDDLLIEKYFDKFYHNNCGFHKFVMTNNILNEYLPFLEGNQNQSITNIKINKIEDDNILYGCKCRPEITNFFIECYNNFPDFTMTLTQSQIKQFYGQTQSYIVLNYNIHATKLRNNKKNFVDFVNFMKSSAARKELLNEFYPPMIHLNEDDPCSFLSNPPKDFTEIDSNLNKIPSNSPMKPYLHMVIDGIVIMHLNEEFVITNLESMVLESTVIFTPLLI